ncbi:hypothetical protein FRC00_013233 [Tulasnella sp. 408]|nr:hypothetical protein FRC00_013233 [Tulasnella sp. 408]
MTTTSRPLITKVENVKRGEAAVRYAAKVDEAVGEVDEEKLGSLEVPLDGAQETLAEVRKHWGRLKRAAAKKRLPKSTTAVHHPTTSQAGTKRKRSGEEALKEEAHLTKRARNAGEKRVITQAEKHVFVRYPASSTLVHRYPF